MCFLISSLAVRTAGYQPLRNQSQCSILTSGPLRNTCRIISYFVVIMSFEIISTIKYAELFYVSSSP